MGKIIREEKITFADGDVYVRVDVDLKEGFSVDIAGEQGVGGELVTIADWTFGLGNRMKALADLWATEMTSAYQAVQQGTHTLALTEHLAHSYNVDTIKKIYEKMLPEEVTVMSESDLEVSIDKLSQCKFLLMSCPALPQSTQKELWTAVAKACQKLDNELFDLRKEREA